MPKTKNLHILISGGYGNANAGDEALMINMLIQLRSIFPTPRITIFSDDPQYSTQRYPEETFIYSGRFGIGEPGKKGVHKVQWIGSMLKSFFSCDVFITGGGTILQDQTHPMFIPFWLSKVFLAQLLFKKTVLYGIGAGPITTRTGRFLTKWIVNNMHLVTLRGKYSFDTLKDLKIHKPVMKILADPAVGLPYISGPKAKDLLPPNINGDKRIKIAFVVRRWYVAHVKNIKEKTWIKGGEEKYGHLIDSLAALADSLIRDLSATILFIPMSVKPPNDDRLAAKDISEKMQEKDFFIFKEDYSPEQIKGLLSLCDGLIGMRFHSLVFYSEFLKPALGIAYGQKTHDFMQYIGLGKFVVDVDNIDFSRAKELFNDARQHFSALKNRDAFSAKVRDLNQKAKENARLINTII